MNQALQAAIEDLRAYRQKHFELGKYILQAADASLYPLDILAVATLNRSLALLAGFCALIEARNLLSAAPLLRLQLDNCLRFSASWLVSEPHEFALRVLQGVQIKKLRDANGNALTDSYLVKSLSKEKPWVRRVYEASSGYIHLSDKHVFNAMQASSKDGTINMKISETDYYVSEELYLEAVAAFKAATDLLLEFMYGWGWTKDNPARMKELKRKRGMG